MPQSARSLVLLGGGHSHAIALRRLIQKPLPSGAIDSITLISEAPQAPYSGMVPGHVAGIYNREDCFIDLQSLCDRAGVALRVDRVVGLNLGDRQVQLASGETVGFRWLSVNLGSTPLVPPGVQPLLGRSIIAAKPIQALLANWDALLSALPQWGSKPLRLVVVGGGAGGVELALAAQRRLQPLAGDRLSILLIQRDTNLLPHLAPAVGDRVAQVLQAQGIELILNETITHATFVGTDTQLRAASGQLFWGDQVLWVTQAAAAPWLAATGLATDPQGFIAVNRYLQSCSHPQVFAAGDVATMLEQPRPKAGVFAVRQGRPLADNLRAAILGQPLKPFKAQKQFLSLINLANGQAIATRSNWTFTGAWAWVWKDYIDRKFMRQFQ